MGKMKAFAVGMMTAALAVGMAVCAGTGTSHAAEEAPIIGEVYNTALESAYGDTFRSVYENRLAGSPLEADGTDGVDTSTGHLILSRTDLSLEGTGGMDFELKRYYDSNEANLGHATVEYVKELEMDTVWVHYTAQDGSDRKIIVNTALLSNHKSALKNLVATYKKGDVCRDDETAENTQRTKIVSREGHDVYGLASGWRFDFPWIETVTLAADEGWGKRPAYLHYGSAGVMNIKTREDSAGKKYSITGLEGYDYQDVRLEDWDKTVDGADCKYLLRDKTGLRTYFNGDGVVVLQKDAHDNTIRFTYTDGIYFERITDSVGREIVFHYSGDGEEKVLASVTVAGEAVAGGVSQKTIRYETEEKSYKPLYGEQLDGYVLTAATVDGSREKYAYKTVERLVNTAGAGVASQRVSTNQSYLLNKVTSDGNEQYYEYRACSLRGQKDDSEGQTRDVVTEQFYVTREYEKDTKTGKKSNGVKYDYFQKKGSDALRTYDDFREKTKDDANIYEAWQYGNSGLRTATVVSRFNPNKYKTNGKYYDYTYKKSKINPGTLRLKKDTKKNVTVYIYNENKMLTEEINYGKEKEETVNTYDKDGQGSLVVLETEKSYGQKGNGCATTREGYVFDGYRNVISEKSPKAYLKKNKGKENFFTTTYKYHRTDKGYPAEDTPYVLCGVVSTEYHISSKGKLKTISEMAENGVDYSAVLEQKSTDGGEYKTISKTVFTYDNNGNETKAIVYPAFGTDGEKELIQNEYTYNQLGQQTKKTVTITSAKRPQDNRTYVAEETTYDSFGNELTHTDEKGLKSQTIYDEETGEESETTEAAGTVYEVKDKTYVSADTLKTMTVDEYGRVSIDINDGLGNTIISKNEAEGTWTESTYEYWENDSEGESDDEENEEEEKEQESHLIEEITYTFDKRENNFVKDENGEKKANYYMEGKGEQILSATKYFYDELGNEIGQATFSNGGMEAGFCSSFTLTKTETEVAGEEDEAMTTTVSGSKEINPSAYTPDINISDYYNQFDDTVLTETVSTTVTDAEGNTVSSEEKTIRGKNILLSSSSYDNDDFGNAIKEASNMRKYQDGKWLPAYESEVLSAYDLNGNIVQTETRTRKEGQQTWQTTLTKNDYDEQGQITKSYTPRGVKENVSTRYTYDILGQKVKEEIPKDKSGDSISYQTISYVYDESGNMTQKNERIDSDREKKTEYTYDERGNLVMVKNCLEDGKSQYVQYVYDVEGNKVRQFTGMTSPLAIEVTVATGGVVNGEGGTGSDDVFSYAGKKYQIKVSGQKKSDIIHETKYEYDGRNRLVAFTDPEGRRETYTYDVNSNLKKTVDKNGNTIKNSYDYRNRLTEVAATPSKKGQEKKTGKETVHTTSYNEYGDIAAQDDTLFAYDDVSGQVTKETTKLTKNKDIVKEYSYDSNGNKSAFSVKVGDDTKMYLSYDYDGESRLTVVEGEDGTEVVSYKYDTDGNLSDRAVHGNGLTTSYTYDYRNNPTSMTNKTRQGVISSYQSEHLVNGQKSKEISDVVGKDGKKSSKTSTYTYDLLGRIKKETVTGRKDISYTYDGNNNRKEMTIGNKVTAYKYNKNDELLRTDTLNTDTEEDSVVIYKNDRNGNQLATVNRHEIPSDKKDETYVDIDVTLGDNRLNENAVNHYNALNQLTQTFTKNYKVSFTYDAEGLRTSKTVNGEKTVYVWDGDQLVMELSDSGKVQKRYIRGNAGESPVYADSGNGMEKQYYVTDPHGNVVQMTDEDGAVTKAYEYDSFGNEVKPDKEDDNPFRYCGEYYDKETEGVYLRARYYQPKVGRFLTRDTYTGEIDETLTLHLYTYCSSDGVNQVDPSGHWGKERISDRKLYGYRYKYVHKNITYYALTAIFKENIKYVNSEKWFKKLIDYSIAPDKKGFKYLKNKIFNKNSLHGKTRKGCEKACKNIIDRLKNLKTTDKKMMIKAAKLTGIALHIIQDYYAHSYGDMPLLAYRKKESFYYGKKDYERANKFHSDWAYKYGKEKKLKIYNKKNLNPTQKKQKANINKKKCDIHRDNKDNPYKDFRYGSNTWVSVGLDRMENTRYFNACNASYVYLMEALKKMKIIKEE